MSSCFIRRQCCAVGVALVFMSVARAQGEEDALRISSIRPGGTARSNGLANAFGAVGADPVSVAINPAGMALYRASSLAVTLSLDIGVDRSAHYGAASQSSTAKVAFPNLALVLRTPAAASGSWKGASYGLVYDRVESHHHSTDALADQVPGSVLDQFVAQANGTPYSRIYDEYPFSAALAWDVFAIDTLPSDSMNYFSRFPAGSDTRQRDLIESRGATARTGFFYAANIDDRIYLGASANIINHRFRRITRHTEYSLEPNNSMDQFEVEDSLSTRGGGFDLSLGALVRVTERLRAGLAFHSPQWLNLTDQYSTTMRSGFVTVGDRGDFDLTAESPDGTFTYRLRTPWRAVGSMAYVVGAHGLVSIDYEHAEVPSMRFAPSNTLEDLYDFKYENEAIHKRFRSQRTLRAGTEWRFGNWYYRGGWAFTSDAFALNDAQKAQGRRVFALGLGYRGGHVTVDFAANYIAQGMKQFTYDPAFVDPVAIDRSRVSTMITVALRP